jgi:sialate O-acetylesterase
MKISCYFGLLFFAASAMADVMPALLFTDHAVLQRGKPVPVWGTAAAGEKVSVSFGGFNASTTAAADGKWKVELPAMTANAASQTLTIQGRNRVDFKDVLVGDVWIASGQSNMEFGMKETDEAAVDVSASAEFPQIRHLKIARRISESPVASISGAWQVAGPETTGEFTAIGYYFAHDLYKQLKVPVGIINSTWGGTRIEAWMPTDALAKPEVAFVAKDWNRVLAEYPEKKAQLDKALADWENEKAAAEIGGQPFRKGKPRPIWGPSHLATPSGLFNGMIAPLSPYAIYGVIWYQGESNAARPRQYGDLFPVLISGWRAEFGQGNFPFYWVQLPNYQATGPDKTEWAFIREGQTRALELPNTGQAVTVDTASGHDLHPRGKKVVGHRLALLALHREFGVEVCDSGPVVEKCERIGAGYRLTFGHTAGGLRAASGEPTGFELAGSDKVFKPATAEIRGNIVMVTCIAVPEPMAVRYAWRNAPKAGLFNDADLPATPYRSDGW